MERMCGMPILKKSRYTIKDIYALPEGERAELINGRIYAMAPPNRLHQKLVMELSHIIKSYIEKNNGECEVYPSPFAVFLNKDEKTYVEPDISVIRDKDKLNDRGCAGAPDFVIEVVSKSRACLKNHSCNLHTSIYGIFCLHSVAVARYAALSQAKSPANCDAHLAESIFQTRSS